MVKPRSRIFLLFLVVLVLAGAGQAGDSPRRVMAHYYAWWGNPAIAGGSGRLAHWDLDKSGNSPSIKHHPVEGYYDSHDPVLIRKHLEEMKGAGIDTIIVSWWGRGGFDDGALDRIDIIAGETGMSVTINVEELPREHNVDAAFGMFAALIRERSGSGNWLLQGERPVFFVYNRAVNQLTVDEWKEVNTRFVKLPLEKRPFLVADGVGYDPMGAFDAVYAYNPVPLVNGFGVERATARLGSVYKDWTRNARASGRLSIATVLPGYDDRFFRKPGTLLDRFDGQTYRRLWEKAIEADADWVLICSWNEWHEATEIEPSKQNGDRELLATKELSKRFREQKEAAVK